MRQSLLGRVHIIYPLLSVIVLGHVQDWQEALRNRREVEGADDWASWCTG
ncbi:MAG: hypothetical protein JWR01_2901 [Subtercola sp.]|nr:hypothetical protein [Subtercola sp.]